MDFNYTELTSEVMYELGWLLQYEVRGDSTPGFPLNVRYATNEQARNAEFDLIVRAAYDRLRLLDAFRAGGGAAEHVSSGLADPISIFIKGEPHSQAKVDQGRYRLIHGVSLVDQLIERFLFHRYQNFCISRYADIPFKAGWGDTDADWQRFGDLFAEMAKPVSTDVSAWDFCFNECQHDMITEFRCMAINYSPSFERIVRNFMEIHKSHVLIFSGGYAYEQQFKGLWNSGRYATAPANSEARSFLAFEVAKEFELKCQTHDTLSYVSRPLAVTMGDDCVEDTSQPVASLVEAYRRRGFDLKVADRLEFCSHELTPEGVVFQNFDKAVFRLACDPSLEHYHQLRPLFRVKAQIDAFDQLLPLVQQLNALEEEEGI